jgi:two-component system response regulator SaeR
MPRTPRYPRGSARIVLGDLVLDRLTHEVRCGDDVLELTKKEFALLWLLASHPGRVFPREDLLEEVWGDAVAVEARTIDAHVTKVRRKLKGYPKYRIDTVWGIGYRLKDPPS